MGGGCVADELAPHVASIAATVAHDAKALRGEQALDRREPVRRPIDEHVPEHQRGVHEFSRAWHAMVASGNDGARQFASRLMPGLARRGGMLIAAMGMTEDMLKDKALVAKFMERLPLKRVAEPADIAGVVAFLASEDARFVNGVNLPVDGGVTASNGQPAMS